MDSDNTLRINQDIDLDLNEIEWQAIRAQGAGGQNVNKVSSAVHLRFDIAQSSLPDTVKSRLLAVRDKRLSKDGTVVIKAQRHRRLELNRMDALDRLAEFIKGAIAVSKPRRKTRPSYRSIKKRLDDKQRLSQKKADRSKAHFD